MKFLPYSNGIRKVNMKKQLKPETIAKLVGVISVMILVSGFIIQRVSNFIAKETLKQRVEYTTVNDLRLDYRVKGSGNYTIVFDNSLGCNLEQWTPVIEKLEDSNVQTFVYNRSGYGYSNSSSRITPEEQAQNLKILLRKAGMSEPYILVGEEYGSLVLTSFAKQFSDSVLGVVLIDPIDEEDIKNKAYKRSQFLNKIRRKIENVGSTFALTMLMDKLNLTVSSSDFEDSINNEAALHEFKTHRTKSSYTKAVYNETLNLINGQSNSQEEGMFNGKPYYLLTKDNNDRLKNLGDDKFTKVFSTTCDKNVLALNDTDNVVDVISEMLATLEKIDLQKKLNNN